MKVPPPPRKSWLRHWTNVVRFQKYWALRYSMHQALHLQSHLWDDLGSLEPCGTACIRRCTYRVIYGMIWEVSSLAVQHASGAVLTEPSMGWSGKSWALRYSMHQALCLQSHLWDDLGSLKPRSTACIRRCTSEPSMGWSGKSWALRYSMHQALYLQSHLWDDLGSLEPCGTACIRRCCYRAIYGMIWEVSSLAVQYASGAVLTEPSMRWSGKSRVLWYSMHQALCLQSHLWNDLESVEPCGTACIRRYAYRAIYWMIWEV